MKRYILLLVILILNFTNLLGEGYEFFKLDSKFNSIYSNAVKNNYSVNIFTNATLEGKYNIKATMKSEYMSRFIDCYFNEKKETISIYINFRLLPREPKRVIVKLYSILLNDFNSKYDSKGTVDKGLDIETNNVKVHLSPLYPFNNNIKVFFRDIMRQKEYATNYKKVSEIKEDLNIETIRSNF